MIGNVFHNLNQCISNCIKGFFLLFLAPSQQKDVSLVRSPYSLAVRPITKKKKPSGLTRFLMSLNSKFPRICNVQKLLGAMQPGIREEGYL